MPTKTIVAPRSGALERPPMLKSRQLRTDWIPGAAVLVAFLLLLYNRGGIDIAQTAWIHAVLLAVCALYTALTRTRRGWLALWIWLLPAAALLQALPLGALESWFLTASRTALLSEVRATGIEPLVSLSLYPYATLLRCTLLAACVAAFLLTRVYVRDSGRRSVYLLAGLVAVGVLQTVIGAEQFASARITGAEDWRAHGWLGNSNHFATLCASVATGALGLALSALRERPLGDWFTTRSGLLGCLAAAGAAICCAGVVLSASRAGLAVLGFGLGTAFILTAHRPLRVFLRATVAAIPIGLVAWALLPTAVVGRLLELRSDPGALARPQIWTDSAALIPAAGPWGHGLGAFTSAFQRSSWYLPRHTVNSAHNDYLEFLVEAGPLGGTLLIALLATAVAFGIRNVFRQPPGPDRAVPAAATAATVTVLAHSLFDFPLQIPALAVLTAVLLGAANARPARHGRSLRWLAPASAAGFAALAAVVAVGQFEGINAKRATNLSREAYFAGDAGKAQAQINLALTANPNYSYAWLARSAYTEARGDAKAALEYTRIANRLRPLTMRTEWALAERQLRAGEQPAAMARFFRLTEALPEYCDTVFAQLLDRGIPWRELAAARPPTVAPCVGAWLKALHERVPASQLPEALDALFHADAPTPEPARVAYVMDRLFTDGEHAVMEALWERLSRSSDPPYGYTWHTIPGRASTLAERSEDPLATTFRWPLTAAETRSIARTYVAFPPDATQLSLSAQATIEQSGSAVRFILETDAGQATYSDWIFTDGPHAATIPVPTSERGKTVRLIIEVRPDPGALRRVAPSLRVTPPTTHQQRDWTRVVEALQTPRKGPQL